MEKPSFAYSSFHSNQRHGNANKWVHHRFPKEVLNTFPYLTFNTAIQYSYCYHEPGQTRFLSRANGKDRNIHKVHTAGSWLSREIWRRWIFADNAEVIVTAADCKPSVVNSELSQELRKRKGKKQLGNLSQAQNITLLKSDLGGLGENWQWLLTEYCTSWSGGQDSCGKTWVSFNTVVLVFF